MRRERKREAISVSYILVLVLFCLAMATSYLSLSYFAAYSTDSDSGDGASTAAFVFDINDNNSQTFQLDLSDVDVPGDSKDVPIYITNGSDTSVSEVALSYTILFETTNNLPITYSLVDAEGNSVENEMTRSVSYAIMSNPARFSAGRHETHQYTLKALWEDIAANKNPKYASEVDRVTLTVTAEQID